MKFIHVPSLWHYNYISHTGLRVTTLISPLFISGREANEVEDQQTADAILSINYRDQVGQKHFLAWIFKLQRQGGTKNISLPVFSFFCFF